MEISSYLIIGLLTVIALLLSITIFIQLRKKSPKPRENLGLTTTAEIEEPELRSDYTSVEKEPEADPVERYLKHLEKVCESVQPVSHNEFKLNFPVWSLPYTMEVASITKYYDEPDDYRPVLTLYFILHDDHSWEVNDRGETAATLAEVIENVEAEIDAYQSQIDKTKMALSPDGILRGRGVNYHTFEDCLLKMRETVKAMDDQWTKRVWEKVGLMPLTMAETTGERLEFSGLGLKNQGAEATENTKSFSLRQGAMIFDFQQTESPSKQYEPGSIYLVRDNPGILDEKMHIADFTEWQGMTDVYLVAEGRWRNPHPYINYHLEVTTMAEWKGAILQPELGQAKGNFPHRAGLRGGAIVIGPFRTGPRPVRAEIQHSGSGDFTLHFISVDGTHQTESFTAHAQFHIEEHETGLFPGKEYIACASGTGPWEIKLSEGY